MTTLSNIEQEVIDCQACPLYKEPFLAVPGVGNTGADLFILAEAPGEVESDPALYAGKTGVPLVGPAGSLLQETLADLGYDQFTFFVTNVVKHRPPRNREPSHAEKQACSHFLRAQLLAVKPKAVLALGRHAIDTLGAWENLLPCKGINSTEFVLNTPVKVPVFGAFHPSYILRDNSRHNTWYTRLSTVKTVLEVLCRIKN